MTSELRDSVKPSCHIKPDACEISADTMIVAGSLMHFNVAQAELLVSHIAACLIAYCTDNSS